MSVNVFITAMMKQFKIQTPLIIINFKAYSEAIGKNAVKKAKIAERVSSETDVCIIVAPQLADISQVINEVSIPVFAQHVDPIKFGRYTGFVLPESVKEAGAAGSLINHAEKRLCSVRVREVVERVREIELISAVCCDVDEECADYALMAPDMIALEPPELIGTGISVSKVKPEALQKSSNVIKQINSNVIVLCGAGVNTGEDVSASLDLGAEGILVGSIVRKKNFYNILSELAEATA